MDSILFGCLEAEGLNIAHVLFYTSLTNGFELSIRETCHGSISSAIREATHSDSSHSKMVTEARPLSICFVLSLCHEKRW